MTQEEFQQRLKELEKKFKELYSQHAPRIAGTTAVRLFKKNFQNEGFFGEHWKEVKRRQNSRNSGNAWGRRRILTGDTGDLGRSIEYKLQSDGTVLVFTSAAAFSSREPYGRVHNEGLKAGRGSGFTMPKRQFIGDHPTLRKEIISETERKLTQIANNN